MQAGHSSALAHNLGVPVEVFLANAHLQEAPEPRAPPLEERGAGDEPRPLFVLSLLLLLKAKDKDFALRKSQATKDSDTRTVIIMIKYAGELNCRLFSVYV